MPRELYEKAGEEYFMRKGDECGSGRSTGTPATRVTKIYRESQRYIKQSSYKSKWRKRKDRRVEKSRLKNYYGYKEVPVKLRWTQHSRQEKGKWVSSRKSETGKKIPGQWSGAIVWGWKHPIENTMRWVSPKQKDYEPEPIIIYKWESTAEPYPYRML